MPEEKNDFLVVKSPLIPFRPGFSDSLGGGKTISEIAYDMGFNYTHHLSRMFKNATGMSPKEYLSALKLK